MLNVFPQQMPREILVASSKFFLMLMIPVVIILLSIAYMEYRLETLKWQSEQKAEISAIKIDMSTLFYESLSDLLILADDNSLFLNTQTSNQKLAEHFIRFANISQSYHKHFWHCLYILYALLLVR